MMRPFGCRSSGTIATNCTTIAPIVAPNNGWRDRREANTVAPANAISRLFMVCGVPAS